MRNFGSANSADSEQVCRVENETVGQKERGVSWKQSAQVIMKGLWLGGT